MARIRRRRRNSGFLNLIGDIFDDVKDFVDDEILDRGRDTERDLRRAGRNWTDEDYGRVHDDRDYDRRHRRRGRRRRRDDDELTEIREALQALTQKISEIANATPSSAKSGTAA